MADNMADGASRGGRVALIAAAVIAVGVVGVSIWQRPGAAPTAVTTAAPSTPTGGDIEQRIAELEAATKATPDDAEAWRRLGWAYYGTEKFAEAAAAYTRATEIDPKDGQTWSALGEALIYTGTPDQPFRPEAVAAFRKALELDPTDPRARYFLAVARDLKGEHKGAIEDWLALLKDTPPGAPWEAGLRDTITRAGAQHGIEVASRMPAASSAPGGAATDAIPGPSREQMAAAAALPPGEQAAMVRGMVDSLAAKLKANPKDSAGWLRLMRAYMVLGEQADAGRALKDARAAFAGDAAAEAEIARGARSLGVPGA
jgi:cytochrome c-type biogenesis protein CcmH